MTDRLPDPPASARKRKAAEKEAARLARRAARRGRKQESNKLKREHQ